MLNLIQKLYGRLRNLFSSSNPDVIIDFIFENGIFYISIKNIGDKPAYRVSITFNDQIIGVYGTKDISSMPLFQNIEFLAPAREIRTLLDTSASYFQSENVTEITSKIVFFDRYGIKLNRTIKHDLAIYRDIGYTQSSA